MKTINTLWRRWMLRRVELRLRRMIARIETKMNGLRTGLVKN
jgi:hypothetical protein